MYQNGDDCIKMNELLLFSVIKCLQINDLNK